ncbi:DUF1768-domain-containing protein [Parathielavia appendiculata]|uniref:DUF1768-domain-containing protein n=1 Tax=Parathielavia appendiculata TaxID=2587402 RepID=A0AAN6Z865_9PEZI|nr:DUF1768-domain-containing protein [Parathielavia appendiculata]
MMYHKAMLFSDPSVAAQILSSSHPRKVRALGRKVSNFADVVWNAHREAIVRRGNMLKFTRPVDATRDGRWIVPLEVERKDGTVTEERSLRELLLGTGEEELVEASPFDRIWGIGYGADKASKVQRERWGMNLLGKALMAVRAELRKELAEGESGTGAVDEKKTDVSEGTKEGKESG